MPRLVWCNVVSNLCVSHPAASKVLVAPVLIVLVVVVGALALVIGKNFCGTSFSKRD